MKLLDVRVNGIPRKVKTKYGDKAVLDVATSDGNFTIWSSPDNREMMGRMNRERVSIAVVYMARGWGEVSQSICA